MPTDREVLKQALDALDKLESEGPALNQFIVRELWLAQESLRTQLAKPDVPCPYIRGSDEGTNWCALAANPGVPDGWKLVPVEPTDEMYAAFWGVYDRDPEVSITKSWKAMLTAAPQPESGE